MNDGDGPFYFVSPLPDEIFQGQNVSIEIHVKQVVLSKVAKYELRYLDITDFDDPFSVNWDNWRGIKPMTTPVPPVIKDNWTPPNSGRFFIAPFLWNESESDRTPNLLNERERRCIVTINVVK